MNVAWETPTITPSGKEGQRRGPRSDGVAETTRSRTAPCARCHDTGIILQTPDPPVQGVDRVATLCPEHDWPVTMTGQ